MAQLHDVLERVQRRLNPRLGLIGILVGMYSKQRNLSREVVEELRTHFGEIVFDTLVRVNVRLAEAPSHGMTIFEYDKNSAGAADFTSVAAELSARLGLQAPLASPPADLAAPQAGSQPTSPVQAREIEPQVHSQGTEAQLP